MYIAADIHCVMSEHCAAALWEGSRHRVPGSLACRRNWISPPPHPQRDLLPLHLVLGGRHTRSCFWGGGGGTQFRWQYRKAWCSIYYNPFMVVDVVKTLGHPSPLPAPWCSGSRISAVAADWTALSLLQAALFAATHTYLPCPYALYTHTASYWCLIYSETWLKSIKSYKNTDENTEQALYF
jgi:hypothetical protein